MLHSQLQSSHVIIKITASLADSTSIADAIDNTRESSKSDTLTIDAKSAVYFQPDSLQIVERMKKVGEENFRAGMGDYIYSINISVEYLETQKLPVFDAFGKKYLKFVGSDKQSVIIKLDTLEDLWGIYLFDPKQKPYYADINMMEEEYAKYFGQ